MPDPDNGSDAIGCLALMIGLAIIVFATLHGCAAVIRAF